LLLLTFWGELESGEGTALDCEPQERVANESARSCLRWRLFLSSDSLSAMRLDQQKNPR